jgi:hypothetical protein
MKTRGVFDLFVLEFRVYNFCMSEQAKKTQGNPTKPPRPLKPFTGLKRADVKVLKPGMLNIQEELRQLRRHK